jgi:undecaprenyl diphosphate synthase
MMQVALVAVIFGIAFGFSRRYCFSKTSYLQTYEELSAGKNILYSNKNVCPVKHLAFVMDGNRRWAKERGLPVLAGHKKGADAAELVIKYCLRRGIKHVSLYAFSLENFKRSENEKSGIFGMIPTTLGEWNNFLIENKIKVRAIGDRKKFPEKAAQAIGRVEELTKNNTGLCVDILFCYGGQQEIVESAKKIALQVEKGLIKPEEIDKKMFEQNLWTGDAPSPDLVIRTGNRKRLSNFLTYQLAYSEIEFLDCYWPDITDEMIDKSIRVFNLAQKNLGA